MTAAVELRMPLGYVEMDTEEMEYLEGGKYYSARKTLSYARTYFTRIMMTSGAGTAVSAIGACFCAAFALSGAYFGYVLSKAVSCYNWVEKQRARYSGSKKCTISATTYGIFVTGLGVSW